MATKKAAVKKAAAKKPISKKSVTGKEKEIKIIIEVVIKNETAPAPPFNFGGGRNFFTVAGLSRGSEADNPEPNFEFKFTPTDGVQLAKIDIDGVILRGSDLIKASKTDADGKLVISVFADVMTTPIPMILEAVGEPNRSMGFTLKFENKDVFKTTDDKKIKIADNRIGILELAAVNLP